MLVCVLCCGVLSWYVVAWLFVCGVLMCVCGLFSVVALFSVGAVCVVGMVLAFVVFSCV